MHGVCSGYVLDGVGCGCVHGMCGRLDHRHGHELSCDDVHGVCCGCVLDVIERRVMHPLYKKFITRSKRFAAHDPENRFKQGDTVRIIECRPISKSKRYEVVYDDTVTAAEA